MELHKKVDWFVERLAYKRKTKNISLEALAEKTGLSRACISFIEKKKRTPKLTTVLLICDSLDTTICELSQEYAMYYIKRGFENVKVD